MNNIIKRVWNQNRLVNIEDLTGMVFQAEADGHTFEISGIDDTGAAVELSGTVSGVFRRPDNADIALTGSASDGVVSVTLSEDCYAVPGRFGLTIFVTSNSQKVAVYACVGTVAVSSTGNVAGDTPQDVVDLINAIEAAVATIPADYTDLMAAIAPAYSSSALYAVGSYAWYDGDLYRCTTAITTAETWTAAHWTAAVIGDDVSHLKSAFDVEKSGKMTIPADWEIGAIDGGTGLYVNTTNYRVATETIVTPPYDYEVTAKTGFQIYPYLFDDNNTLILKVGWVTSYTINKGQKFTMQIRKNPEDIHVPVADKDEFINAVLIASVGVGQAENAQHMAEYNQEGANYGITLKNLFTLDANDAINNTYKYIDSNGVITPTTSGIGVSDKIKCVPGDKIKFTLSSGTGYTIFAVFNSKGQMTKRTAATGYSNYITETYTFVDGDSYFYISGVIARVTDYSVAYAELPYVLDDMNDRITALENGSVMLPSYWQSYLPDKIKAIQLKDALVGNDGDSFVFITDVHLATNTKYSPDIIRNIIDSTSVNKVFNGGDTLDEGVTHDDAIYDLFSWQKLMHGIRQYNIVGNHDNNNYNSQNPTGKITAGEFYGVMDKPAEQWIDTYGETYFVVDNESMKMRYIVVCNAAFGGHSDISQNPQKAWLESKLTEKDSTWTMIVFQHYLWGSSTSSIHAQGQAVIDIINGVYSSIQADFIGIIAGHTHTDYSTTESTNGYLLIATNCDTRSGSISGYDRTAGTTNEQSFDVFHVDKTNKKLYATRIGAGSNRDWTYT